MFRRSLALNIKGVVQGVGFRPAVYRVARECGLVGTVQNQGGSVEVIVEGDERQLERFQTNLKQGLPPQAVIEKVESQWRDEVGYPDFSIIESSASEKVDVTIPADLATCKDCLAEFSNPDDRRFHYPFTTCTNCGPRYTVVESMPYDRETTTLREFPLCLECQHEYDDPADRRFHAESTACPVCGPSLKLFDAQWQDISADQPDMIDRVQQALGEGKVIGLRGLGGYLLVCNAENPNAIKTLRQRKNRPHKPFAVMARNLDLIKAICITSAEDESLLKSSVSPVVILNYSGEDCSSGRALPVEAVSPDRATIGMMLPTTPLHRLLFGDEVSPRFDYLIMTSGNAQGEPICRNDEEAMQRLSGLADIFLTHDRDIARVCDDSVFMKIDSRQRVVRRARGIAPEKLPLPESFTHTVLAMGADLKNTFCLAYEDSAVLSPHLGDLNYLETLNAGKGLRENLLQFLDRQPDVIATDLHPDYQSSIEGQKLARSLRLPLVEVQHHHAHAASCMAENGVDEAIALVFDGSGMGSDGTIWGGECLHVDDEGFRRVACLEQSVLVGGEHAILNPQRQAITRLLEAGVNDNSSLWKVIGVGEWELSATKRLARKQGFSVKTSSAGRLFDAVSSLLGLCPEAISYEGQAAIRLESLALASGCRVVDCLRETLYPFQQERRDGVGVIKTGALIQAIADELLQGRSKAEMAWQFHNTLAEMAVEMASFGWQQTGLKTVALSGGVFQNSLFSSLARIRLESRGYKVIMHRRVPCNDGGIAFGQAVIVGKL